MSERKQNNHWDLSREVKRTINECDGNEQSSACAHERSAEDLKL
jgi:hypothetical protein